MSESMVMTGIKIDSGCTLNEMLGVDNYIEIPIIQRDYAQGRDNAKEIREDFLKDLFEHLVSKEKIKLSFVYGAMRVTSQRTIYIPYDGQQRITLIYLLTLYMAAASSQWNEIKKLSRFKYYTRDFATEFCSFLTGFDEINRQDDVDNVFKRVDFSNSKLVEQIKQDVDFFSAWEHDPTTASMLVVLEAIHNEFLGRFNKLSDEAQAIKAMELLDGLNNGLVFFDWCSISASDNIYIKMNGRGKPLSAFDNFKNTLYAELDKLRAEDIEKGRTDRIEFLKSFETKMDGKWTDMFWAMRNQLAGVENYDIAPFMMNFLFYVFELKYAEKIGGFYFGGRRPFSWIDEKNVVSFLSMFKEKCKISAKDATVTLDDYVWLSKLLDVVENRLMKSSNNNTLISEIEGYLSEYDIFDELSTSKKRKKTDTRYVLSAQTSIVAAMYYWYLVNVSSFDLNGNLLGIDDTNRDEWLKFIGRITKTIGHYKGRYDALQRDKHIFTGYAELFVPIVFANNATGDLIKASVSFDENQLKKLKKHFDSSHAYNQLYEEIYKMKLISADPVKWIDRINIAEKNLPYFDNQILFLLMMAEDSQLGILDENKYDSYLRVIQSITDENGIKSSVQNKFTAVLLHFADYRIQCGEGYGNAEGLCSNKSSENFKWRHFFDILDGKMSVKLNVLRQTFDLIDSKGTLEDAYNEIKDKSTGVRWRDVIIKNPDILNYGSNHRIIFKADDGSWYLIRSNGVAKQVHANSLTDSINLELYGICKECGYNSPSSVFKGVRVQLTPDKYIERIGNDKFKYVSGTQTSNEMTYDNIIAYLKGLIIN